MDIDKNLEGSYSSLKKDKKSQEKPVKNETVNPSATDGKADQKGVDDKTPVDLGFDIEEVKRAIAGVTRGTDTADDTSETGKNIPSLHDYFCSLAHRLFEQYRKLILGFYYDASEKAERLSLTLEDDRKLLTILGNKIRINNRILSASGFLGLLLTFHKQVARKNNPDLLIEFDRCETDVKDDEMRLKNLENARDRLKAGADFWDSCIQQAEDQTLSFETIDTLVLKLKAGEDDVPKVDLITFLGSEENENLIRLMEKFIAFMKMKANKPPVATDDTVQKKDEQPVSAGNNRATPSDKLESENTSIPSEILLPDEDTKTRVAKPDYSKVVIDGVSLVSQQKASAPEQKETVSAHDKTVVDFTSPLHSDAVKTDDTKAPESKNEA